MQSVAAIRKLAICQARVGANDNRFTDRKRDSASGGFFLTLRVIRCWTMTFVLYDPRDRTGE
jgi:hypothetical protein